MSSSKVIECLLFDMDTQAEIERLKALVAETNRRTALVNAYADKLEQEFERKEKEASELREQIASLEANLKSKYNINIWQSIF